jgi:hypothetical protein
VNPYDAEYRDTATPLGSMSIKGCELRKWPLRDVVAPRRRRHRYPVKPRAASSMAELWTFNPQQPFFSPLLKVKHFRLHRCPRVQAETVEYPQVTPAVTDCSHPASKSFRAEIQIPDM